MMSTVMGAATLAVMAKVGCNVDCAGLAPVERWKSGYDERDIGVDDQIVNDEDGHIRGSRLGRAPRPECLTP